MSNQEAKLKVFHSDQYDLPLPDGHRFPMEKYSLLRNRLVSENILTPDNLFSAPFASEEDILRVHTSEFYEDVKNGTLKKEKQRLIGFPWSPVMIQRSRASVGGYISAVENAIEFGIGGNLSGGTHHSFRDRGEGFCVFNDFAVAAFKLISERSFQDILILDLDVHHGNGNADIMASMPEIFVVSFHGRKNYPYKKPPSDLDVEFECEAKDDEYLNKLDKTLQSLSKRPWDIILYQAGVDSLAQDKLGKLSLSHEGLRKRDQMVLDFAYSRKIPIALGLGGGYSNPIEPTIEAHLNTYREIKNIYKI